MGCVSLPIDAFLLLDAVRHSYSTINLFSTQSSLRCTDRPIAYRYSSMLSLRRALTRSRRLVTPLAKSHHSICSGIALLSLPPGALSALALDNARKSARQTYSILLERLLLCNRSDCFGLAFHKVWTFQSSPAAWRSNPCLWPRSSGISLSTRITQSSSEQG
ncbi:hypothetical protein LZ31DRAFT_231434 [Colletotrichum somersetense]|nr:hypothetical protein LZ31DRAFT_231434 [Colletotrichum somersetense]